MKNLVEFHIKVPCEVKQEGLWFYASCPPLDIHSQGHTREESLHNLSEAIALFIESCFERGVLDKALKECGLEAMRNDGLTNVEDDCMLDVKLPLFAKHGPQAYAY